MSSVERLATLTGVEVGVKVGWVELQLGYFWALRARLVSTTGLLQICLK